MADIVRPNYIESILNEARKPQLVTIEGRPSVILPDGYKISHFDHLMPRPLRKSGTAHLMDTESFIDFVNREGSLASCRIYVDADFCSSKVHITAVLNDHAVLEANWRDYRAIYEPRRSVEWGTWIGSNSKVMSQVDFATFLEDNSKDVATVKGFPSGAEIYAMALAFESKQEIIVKSTVRLQSGSMAFDYTDQEDDATVKRMYVFQRFALGIAPFFNGSAYQLTARLKYKITAGKPTFWYELVRPDLVLQDATSDLIERLKTETGLPLLMGRP